MGRQTRFYAHPDDFAGLAEGLRSLGAAVIDERSPTAEPVIRNIADSRDSIRVLLTLPEYLSGLRPRYLAHQQAWRFSESDDPLVQLSVWQPHQEILRPGRVYFTTRSLEGDEGDLCFEDKPAEFVAFAERVRLWIRRWCQKREDLLLSPSLAARFDRGEIVRKGIQGELELVPHSG
jgi:hypothetical protein